MRIDNTQRPLQPSYESSNRVLRRGEHPFSLDFGGKPKTASLDRLKFFQEADGTGRECVRSVHFDVRQSTGAELPATCSARGGILWRFASFSDVNRRQ